MMKPLRFGLVAEGATRHSYVLQLPRLSQDLGPVKSSSFGAARRLCNFLRAGYAVEDYEELQAASIILLRVPDAILPEVIGELCRAGLPLGKVSFVLCESWLRTDALNAVRKAGSSVATLMSVPTTDRNWFIVEGEAPAVRLVKRFIEQNNAHVLELRPNAKSLYFAAELLATALPVPLLVASQRALRAGGLNGKAVTKLSEGMIEEMSRGILKGARTIWGGPLIDCSPELAGAHLEALRRSAPELAAMIDAHLPNARRAMSKHRVRRDSA
jgi:predicted short-subunit dehydrogenase-like oxidoreductase (DUF2520 family)